MFSRIGNHAFEDDKCSIVMSNVTVNSEETVHSVTSVALCHSVKYVLVSLYNVHGHGCVNVYKYNV